MRVRCVIIGDVHRCDAFQAKLPANNSLHPTALPRIALEGYVVFVASLEQYHPQFQPCCG